MQEQRLRLFIAKRIRGLLAGEHPSYHLSTRGHDLEEKRKFHLGDDPRGINLIATAKRGGENPRVTINRIEKGANLIFLVDCSASTRFGSIIGKYHYAIELIRIISMACSGGGNRLRFIAFDEKIRCESRFSMSKNIVDEFIEEMSKLPPRKVTTDLRSILAALCGNINRFSLDSPSLIFIISDFIFEVEFKQELEQISQLSDVVPIIIRDPVELLLPKPRFGLVRLVDPETGQKILARQSVNPLDKLAPILKRCNIDWVEMNTGIDIGMCLENLIKLFEQKREER